MYYKQMDGLRCLCILGVLFQHFVHPAISKYFLTALAGVDLFFIISGFLITESLLKLKEKYDFKKASKIFYVRRTLRIFPLYYLYVLILVIFFFKDYANVMPWVLLYGVNFLIMYVDGMYKYIGHLWSLAVEEQFYLVWPFLMLLAAQKRLVRYTVFLIGVGLAYTAYNWLAGNIYNYNYMHPLSCAIALLSGALMAIWKYKGDSKFYILKNKVGLSVFIFTAGCLLIAYMCAINKWDEQDKIFVRLLTCLLGFAVVPMVAENNVKGLMGKFLENKVVVYIGRISYGIYIYHYIVMHTLRPYVEKEYAVLTSGNIFDSGPLRYVRYNPTVFQLPFYTAVVILVATISYYGFEKRFLNLKAKFN